MEGRARLEVLGRMEGRTQHSGVGGDGGKYPSWWWWGGRREETILVVLGGWREIPILVVVGRMEVN